jgi:beta-glucosidase
MVYEDTPSQPYYPAKERNSDYREALFVGYRYFDTFGKEVRYPFGYGLSYTTFEYSDLKVDEKGVAFTLKNTGDRAGAEVAQLYVGLPGSKILRAGKELKGFEKIKIAARDTARVAICIKKDDLRVWENGWKMLHGRYTVSVAAAADDVRLTADMNL